MEKVTISKDYFKSFTPLYDMGSESFMLYKDDIIAKIINKEFLREDRERITEKLEELEYDGLVKPEFLLYDRKKYMGYVMKFLKDFKSFYELLNDEAIPFNERKKLMLELSQIFDYFNKKQFAYFDIHGNNFLLKDNKIHIIDLDGGVFQGYKNCKLDYNAAHRVETKYLSAYTLAFIYGMDRVPFIKCEKKSKKFLNTIPYQLRKFYEYAISDDFGVFEGISESLDLIDESTFNESSLLLKKKIW
jgi:hypothetical protein